MASSPEFMQSVAARLEDAGTITYRKMFGEYCVYCDGKPFGCVCDDRLFVKITEPEKPSCRMASWNCPMKGKADAPGRAVGRQGLSEKNSYV